MDNSISATSADSCEQFQKPQPLHNEFVGSMIRQSPRTFYDWAGVSLMTIVCSIYFTGFVLLVLMFVGFVFRFDITRWLANLPCDNLFGDYCLLPALIAGIVILNLQCSFWWWCRLLNRTYNLHSSRSSAVYKIYSLAVESILALFIFSISSHCCRLFPTTFWSRFSGLQAFEILIFTSIGVWFLTELIGKGVSTDSSFTDHQ